MSNKNQSDIFPHKATKSLGKGKTLIFAPHPDDEVFGCGGAIITHKKQNDELKVVIVTDGDFPVTKKQETIEYTKIRKEESLNAAKILGYNTPLFLNYPDGSLTANEDLITHLFEIIRGFEPQNIYLPAHTEIHPDHLALNYAGTEAAKRYEPNIDLIYYEIGQIQSANLLLDITELHDQLDEAMECFKSQLEVQNYKYHVNALHAYRTYTLDKEVKYVEAYQLIYSNKIKIGNQLWEQKTAGIDLPTISKPSGVENPLISVIVRTMNRPELAEALESLSKQTYPNVEVIVVDALGTNELNLGDRCGNFQLRVISKNKQLPRSEAANAGLNAVKGDYFCFLDEDDLLLSEHIFSLFEILKNSEFLAVYSNIKRVNGKGELLNIYDSDFNFHRLLWENFIPNNALLFQTEVVKHNCSFDNKFEIYEDWDFLIQISLLGKLAQSNRITGVYRDTNTSGVQNNFNKVNKYRTLLFEKWKTHLTNEHYIGFLNYLSSLNLNEKKLYENKYIQELSRFEEAQSIIKDLQANIKQSKTRGKNSLDKKEKKIAFRDKEILDKDNIINKFISEVEILSKSLNKKNEVIKLQNKQSDKTKSKLNKLNLHLMNKENIIENKSDDIINLNQQLKILESTIKNLTKSLSWKITKPLRSLKNNKLRAKYLLSSNKRIIYKSGFFNPEYYLENNADLRESGDDPLTHFAKYGGFEGRNPGPKFDADYYNKHNPDVIVSGLNPLLHYILYGKNEGRQIIGKEESIYPDSKIKQQTTEAETENQELDISDNSCSNDKINLIRKSKFFNSNYYLRTNTDVKALGIDPAEHYLIQGWKEGRNPSRDFNTNYYLSAYNDVKDLGINPLVHYEESGHKELRFTKMFEIDEEKCFKKADINNIEIEEDLSVDIKIAIVCHIYYTELVDELINYFKNINHPFEIFISTSHKNINYIQNKFSIKLPEIKTNIIGYSNRGRDIAPFLSILKNNLMNYDLVCKIHTKKSNHDINLTGWRKYLLDNLLGNFQIINKIINEFIKNEKLGAVWPVSFPYITQLGLENGWGTIQNSSQNLETAIKHFPELDLGNINGDFDFPQGSMFWFRPKALELLVSKNITTLNFDEEERQIDNTLAHVVERLIGIIVNKSGFETKSAFFTKEVFRTAHKKNYKLSNSKSILFIAHDLFRAGAEILLLNLIDWLNRHTSINLYVLALKPGNDGGKLLPVYNDVASVFLWDEYCLKHHEEDAINAIKEEIGEIDLIYGNTIIAANLYSLLKIFNTPYITHIHELEESIQRYTTKEVRKNWKKFTSLYIACSSIVEDNLIQKHGITQKKIACINEFIKPIPIELPDRISQRNIHGLATGKTIIWGCGTIYWRKGTDIFIETAKTLKDKGVDNFIFYWIGGNYWDAESEEWGEWKTWENLITQNNLNENIVFLGEKENPRDYFTVGDIFFLPSREDPFPLVCLEAAECGLPIVCFEDAGGMPEFVENDAGKVVPFLDINAAANALEELIVNEIVRTEKGKNARTKLFQRHTVDIAAPRILQICHSVMHSNPLVSVIVPVYNHEKFLNERIESILNQSFRDIEIIILDDASTDNSYEIAKSYEWHPAIKVIKNDINSGSPFKQWQKGLIHSKGEFIWFAEGDDFCEPDFLQKLLPSFNKHSVALAYCNSTIVDESNKFIGDYTTYYEKLDFNHWKYSYKVTSTQEINFGLGVKNSIPNASAVLLRKSCISDAILNKINNFEFSGDWYLYLQVIKGKEIAFCSEKLNYHRKHNKTVSTKFNTDNVAMQSLLSETEAIHNSILKNYSIYPFFIEKWANYIEEQVLALFPHTTKNNFNNYYAYNSIKDKIKKASLRNKKIVFLTTNDGSANGGSEQLWQHAAKECKKNGLEVLVVIKKWSPEPFFIKELRDIGIEILFKGPGQHEKIITYNPNLMVISIGDQDEGIDWYEYCNNKKIPYVIVNQLTKEPKYWPVNPNNTRQLTNGYLSAEAVLFTCKNNHSVMEKRLNCKIPNASIFYNPLDVNRDTSIAFPSVKKGLEIAIVGNLLRIHKGQHLAIELFSLKKWQDRAVHLNIYGEGDDEIILKEQVKKYNLNNVTFHGHTNKILEVWKKNHAVLFPSFMEGLPLVLVGAMLCSRIPILTDIGAHSEVVKDNINGFIAKQPTVEALDEALERAYAVSQNWEEIGEKTRQSILNYLPEDPIEHFIKQLILFAK